MRKRRVAVLYTHPLFGRGVAQLLRADEQLEVTCLKASLAEAAEELRRLRPYAVVAEGCQGDHLLHEAVRDLPAALFIAVRIDDDLMDVYHSRQVVTALPENLVRAVRLGLKNHPREQPPIGD
jgi:DNA-binding NarL/FixJ family response regulator